MDKKSVKARSILVFECRGIPKLLAIINRTSHVFCSIVEWRTENVAVKVVLCNADAKFPAESFAFLSLLLKVNDLNQVVHRLTLPDPSLLPEACVSLLSMESLDIKFPSLNISSPYSHLCLRRHWRAMTSDSYAPAPDHDLPRSFDPSPEVLRSIKHDLLDGYVTIHFVVQNPIVLGKFLSSTQGLATYGGPHTFEIIYVPDANMASILIAIALLPQPGRSFIAYTRDRNHSSTPFNDIRILLGIDIVLPRCETGSHLSLHGAIWTLPQPANNPIVVDIAQLARFCNRVYPQFQGCTAAFVAFLSILKIRFSINWEGFMRQVLKLAENIPCVSEGKQFQSLCSQLHIQSVYTVDAFTSALLSPFSVTKASMYLDFRTPVVCLILSLSSSALSCEIVHTERKARHCFSSLHAAYGSIQYDGHIPIIREDDDDDVESDLLVVFWPRELAFSHSDPNITSVGLFAPHKEVTDADASDVTFMLCFDKHCRHVSDVGIKVEYEDSICCDLLEEGEEVRLTVISSSEIELNLGGYQRVITFPIAIDGSPETLQQSVWRESHFMLAKTIVNGGGFMIVCPGAYYVNMASGSYRARGRTLKMRAPKVKASMKRESPDAKNQKASSSSASDPSSSASTEC
ncbi:hypothetical protein BDZ89DRAFT_1050618 [Hymenopellis radicata]|nr:hypothetical protein BDZ89DRAFT_1050618 [Hymenopellis radicata]